MKTLRIFVVIMLLCIAWNAWALKPMAAPEALQQEAANSVVIHKGTCQHEQREELCMVGYDQAKDTFWLLLFNQEGVMFRVVEVKDGKETIRWSHPELSI
jgi:hypothetical protein